MTYGPHVVETRRPLNRWRRTEQWLRKRAGLLTVLGLALITAWMLLDFYRSGRSVVESQPGTGIPVAEPLKTFYQIKGGAPVLGYPVSDLFQERPNGPRVQYFENIKLEYYPAGNKILVADLGRKYLPGESRWILAEVDSQEPGAALGEEGIIVRGAFLSFYQANDGATLLGDPLTPELNEAGTRAQYFENGRLEWRPELPLEQRVQLGSLGDNAYLEAGRFADPGRNKASEASAVQSVNVKAAFKAPILYSGDQQVIFVEVETPASQKPVKGLRIWLTVTYEETESKLLLPLTDEMGHSSGDLTLNGVSPGQKVLVSVTAERPADGLDLGSGTFSFRTWW